jgi:hypothetical protein
MYLPSQRDAHLHDALAHDVSRRSFAARLDMTLKRSKMSTGRVARSLGVNEGDVALWRAGVTVPAAVECRQLSQLLGVDAEWLCVSKG